MKRIILLFTTVCIILLSMPFVPQVLAAEHIAYSESAPSVSDWSFTQNANAENYSQTNEDGAFVVRKLTNTGTNFSISKKFSDFVIESDTVNNTRLLSNRISGKIAIEFDYEVDLKEVTSGTATFIQLSFSGNDDNGTSKSLANLRLTSIKELRNHSRTAADATSTVHWKLALPEWGDRSKLRVEIDTENGFLSTYLTDSSGTTLQNVGWKFLNADFFKFFNSVGLTFASSSMAEDSYFKLYGINIYKVEDSAEAVYAQAKSVFDQMPASLVPLGDPKNITTGVTDVDVAYFGAEHGATLSTSNAEIMNLEGEIVRDVQDEDVSIFAQYSRISGLASTPFIFKKAYDFTVKALDGVENKILASESAAGFDENLWTFEKTNESNSRKIDVDGLTISTDGGQSGITATRTYRVPVDDTPNAYEKLFDLTHAGVYEFDLSAIAKLTENSSADLSVGYQNPETNKFTDYAVLRFDRDELSYKENNSFVPLNMDIYDVSQSFKLRMYTADEKLMLWSDGHLITTQTYNSQGKEVVNAIRMKIDGNSSSRDSLTLESAEFIRRLDGTHPIMDLLRDATERITITNIIDDPDDAKGNLKTLPPSLDGNIQINWSTNNPSAIDIKTGAIYRSDIPQLATVSATFIKDGFAVEKEFYLKLKESEDANELLDAAVRSFKWGDISNQPIDDIRYDVVLPDTLGFGTVVNWTSSNEAVFLDGKINKSALIEDGTPARLTATVSIPGVSDASRNKVFDLKLKKRGYENTIIDDSNISGPYIFSADGQNLNIKSDVTVAVTAAKANGSISIRDIDGNIVKTAYISGNNISIDNNVIASVGNTFTLAFTLLPDVNRMAVWVDDMLSADYIDFPSAGISGIVCDGVTSSNVKVFMDDYSIFDLNSEIFGYMEKLPALMVENDLNLIKDSILGVNVEWFSGNTAVISNEGKIADSLSYGISDFTVKLSNTHAESLNTNVVTIAPVMSKQYTNILTIKDLDFAMGQINSKPNAFDGKYGTFFDGTIRPGRDNSIKITLDGNSYVNQVYICEGHPGISSYRIEYSNDNISWEELCSGTITDEYSRIIQFEPVEAKYLKITILEPTLNNKISIAEIAALFVTSPEKLAQIDMDGITLDTTTKINGDIVLPQKGKYGSNISWTSSNPDVISNTGVYTAPDYDEQVYMTPYVEVNGKKVLRTVAFPPFTAQGKNGSKGSGIISSGGGNGGGGGDFVMVAYPPTDGNTENTTENPGNSIDVKYGSFRDVPENHWAYSYIEQLSKLEIISINEESQFEPERMIKREEFIKMLITAKGAELSTGLENVFSDVDSDEWYANYVLSAQNIGLVSGMSGNEFGIGMNITRQDAALMIARAMDIEYGSIDGELFGDNDDISEYASNAVYAMRNMGLILGYEDNEFKPHNFLSRAEAATIIARVLAMLI